MPEALRSTYCCQFSFGKSPVHRQQRHEQEQQQQRSAHAGAGGAPHDLGQPQGGPQHPGQVYPDSLVSAYLPHGRLQLAPALLQLQPSSLTEALRFIERVRACFEAGLPARENALQEAEPLAQVCFVLGFSHRLCPVLALGTHKQQQDSWIASARANLFGGRV